MAGGPGSGRIKGSMNRSTISAKHAFEYAFIKLGGTQALAQWAKKNPTEFYKMYSKMLPAHVEAVVTLNHEEALADLENAASIIDVYEQDAIEHHPPVISAPQESEEPEVISESEAAASTEEFDESKDEFDDFENKTEYSEFFDDDFSKMGRPEMDIERAIINFDDLGLR